MPGGPTSADRREMRRRARKSAHLREALIRELGELLVEMNRLGRRNDALVTRKAREIEALDRQLDGLAQALGERRTVTQVTLAGIAGSCSRCRTLLGTDDRFCSRCGKPVEGEGAGEAEAGAPPAAQLQLETVGVESR